MLSCPVIKMGRFIKTVSVYFRSGYLGVLFNDKCNDNYERICSWEYCEHSSANIFYSGQDKFTTYGLFGPCGLSCNYSTLSFKVAICK